MEAVTRSLVAAKADGCEVLTPPCRPAMTRSNTLIVREEGQSGQDYCLAECSVPASVDLELRSDPDDDTVSTTTEDEEALDGESSESLVAAVTALHTAAAKSGKCKVLMPPSRSEATLAHHSLRSVGSLRRLVRSSQRHTCKRLAFSSATEEPRAACMSVKRVSLVGGCRRLVCPACVPSSYMFLHVSVQARRNASEHIHIRGVGIRTECAGTGCAARGGPDFVGAGD